MQRGAAVGLLCLAMTVGPASASAAPVPVNGTSGAFFHSIGVGVHNYYPETAYADRPRVKQLLLDLGAKHLRGSVMGGRPAAEYESMRDIAAAGMKWTYITGRPDGNQNPNNFLDSRALLTDPNVLAGTAEGLEGPNEYDDRAENHSYWGPAHPAWKENLYQYMAQSYAGFKSDERFSALPHYGPSFARDYRRREYAAMPGSGQLMDAPNAHIYPGGRPPEAAVRDQVIAVAREFGNESRKPAVTETGYHNAIHGGNWWHYGVSEHAQSIYILRDLLAAFEAGAPRTFIYQLMDLRPEPDLKDQEEHFGLVGVEGDRSASWTTWTTRKKPAFEALREMLEITKDTGTAAGPPALDHTVTGGPPELKKMLLSRSDGSVYLVLWNPASLYSDPVPGSCDDPRIPVDVEEEDRCNYAWAHFSTDQGPLFPADVPVTLELGERAQVSTERPHSQTSFTSLGSGRTFSLNVGPDPLFVKVEPTYGLVVKSDDPVAHLRLNETSGAPVDSAGRGATTQPWVAAPTYGQSGAVGGGDTAVKVEGDQRATVTLASPVHTARGASVELWVKPDPAVPTSAEFLSGPAESGTDRINMRTHTPAGWGLVRGATPGEAGDMVFDGFDSGQWHHLVLTMGGDISASRTYLDGAEVDNIGVELLSHGGNWFDIRSFTIGGHASAGFKGVVDELAVYPRILSPTRICAHYRAAGGSC